MYQPFGPPIYQDIDIFSVYRGARGREDEDLINEVEELTVDEGFIHQKYMKNTAISTIGREISIPNAVLDRTLHADLETRDRAPEAIRMEDCEAEAHRDPENGREKAIETAEADHGVTEENLGLEVDIVVVQSLEDRDRNPKTPDLQVGIQGKFRGFDKVYDSERVEGAKKPAQE
ncbi:hypothetical protein D910_07820 [Dendroctonus ponderosae]|uniref:Uncharacterized protein n=1 Tax=Dendroctonus ponderosae TaxID=77166 RepID=U4UJV6_DENPD|nr:hypothetical protein D910_07820 [Dendroctonus ponderosae]